MLTQEENALLTQVGPGTPMGELLRRYWQPICPASDLTPGQPEKRLRIIGEDLVVFPAAQGGYGRLVEQPFEPSNSMMRHTIRHPAYPVEALGGLLFAYMGPLDKKPLLPRWDVLVWEDGKRTIRLQETLECNWLQAQENSADVTHTYF